jgi:hypothetical protein
MRKVTLHEISKPSPHAPISDSHEMGIDLFIPFIGAAIYEIVYHILLYVLLLTCLTIFCAHHFLLLICLTVTHSNNITNSFYFSHFHSTSTPNVT